MRWTERQRAMLREMGIAPFWPESPPEPEVPAALAEPDSSRMARAAADPLPAPALATELPLAASLPGQAVRPPAARAPTPPSGQLRPISDVMIGPRPAGIEQMAWPALREAVAGCQACGLCQSRTQSVFGVGHEQAEWMIIGEAPGEQEDRQGEPFVGRAGQLLDRMLQAVGRTRAEAPPAEQVFITNVLKCRPPANRNPQPQEVAQCEPYLMRQVELVRPKLIVAMGRFAAQSLLKSSEPIGRLRGRVHEVGGVPVIVTYHPAYLLRSPADKGMAWDDLCLAREVWAQAARPSSQSSR